MFQHSCCATPRTTLTLKVIMSLSSLFAPALSISLSLVFPLSPTPPHTLYLSISIFLVFSFSSFSLSLYIYIYYIQYFSYILFLTPKRSYCLGQPRGIMNFGHDIVSRLRTCSDRLICIINIGTRITLILIITLTVITCYNII